MTKEKLKTVVETLRKGGMNSEEILNEMGCFLQVSQTTLNAMQKAGMTAEEILKELTSEEQEMVQTAKPSREDINAVKKYLREVVGIPTHINGYEYIASAVTIYRKGMAMTKGLYPMVAKQCGTTSSRVERSIRHAIETAWDYNVDLPKILGILNSPNRGKPTNAQFITTIVEILG